MLSRRFLRQRINPGRSNKRKEPTLSSPFCAVMGTLVVFIPFLLLGFDIKWMANFASLT
jgi:hypothetical protein